MKYLKKLVGTFAIALSLLTAVGSAVGGEYPERPIKLICPYAAGGLTDVIARVLAKRLSERLGQPVIVENRTGAGGIIGVEQAAKSPADGYTLVLVAQGLASVNPSLYKKLPYDTLRDFAPISLTNTFSLVLIGSRDFPPATVTEFISMARAKPGALSYGSAGNASTSHLMTELLKSQAGIDVLHVPFRGESAAFPELMAGRLTAMFATVGGALPLIEAGKVRALAVGTKERSKLLPQVPTIAESGAAPGFDVSGWYGILAPAAVPKAVAARLSKELMAIAREPAMREQFSARGVESVGSTSEEFSALIKSETERWRKVVNQVGIKPD
ncbi:MAG: Bug family tripartite tricarboxylate transporter substrate binding protein [Acidovorax defluvii]